MLLAIDIGNTNISFGLFKDNCLLKGYSVAISTKGYSSFIKELFIQKEIGQIIICSVVPRGLVILEKNIRKSLGKKPCVIGRDAVVPIKNLYRRPQEVGQDRLVNAYAVTKIYGFPAIVIDFGTAVTFDVISKRKEYLGGMIMPGLDISLDSLAERTALLPKIKLSKPKELIGRDTKNSIISGIVYGFAALTDDLTRRIKKEVGRNAKVVCTGGYLNLIGSYCRCIDRMDKNLTLKGINLIYQEGRRIGKKF